MSLLFRKAKANYQKYLDHFLFYSSSAFDRLINLFDRKARIWSGENQLNHILFVTEDPRIDILRFYSALKESFRGEVRVMIPHTKLDGLFLTAGFKEVIFFRNHWDFRNKLNQLKNIDIVHGFTRRCYVIEILLKEYQVPVVISVKDTSVASFGLEPPRWYLRKEIPSEKYSFENVDGILAESLEVNYAYRLFQSKKKPKRIYFPNLCEDAKIIPVDKNKTEGAIHLVYVGAVRGSQDSKADHGNIQMHWLIESLNKQKIHFHIYPNPSLARPIYEEYFKMSEELPFFHMHESVSPEKMNKEIAQYHFGLIPFFNEDTQRSPLKRYYSSSLKIFNYLESGLPTIISKDMGHQRWILERYGLAIGVTKSNFHDLKSVLNNYNYPNLVDNLETKRNQFRLNIQMQRVLSFYKQIIKTKVADYNE
jgi:hypothetical protein